jgi:hypothetical protein
VDRLLSRYRVRLSSQAAIALLVANTIPLAGVVCFGWDLTTILVIYWLENGVVGIDGSAYPDRVPASPATFDGSSITDRVCRAR